MPQRRARGLTALLLAMLVGCGDRAPTTTPDELTAAITAYEQGAPDPTEDRITALFAKLDAEIASLRADELSRQPASRDELRRRREALETTRHELQARYLKARVARLGTAAGETLRQLGDQVGRGLEDAGRKLRKSMDEPNDSGADR